MQGAFNGGFKLETGGHFALAPFVEQTNGFCARLRLRAMQRSIRPAVADEPCISVFVLSDVIS